jgi:hypothetical protein
MIFNKVEIDYKVCDEVIFINTVSVKHEYRKQGVFKELLYFPGKTGQSVATLRPRCSRVIGC